MKALRILRLALSVVLVAGFSFSALVAEPTGSDPQPASKTAVMEQASPSAPSEQRVQEPRKIEEMTPFVAVSVFRKLPARKAEDIRFFAGMESFGKSVTSEGLTVWPIARFKSAQLPPDEGAFRTALARHAARLGADYVVVVTDPGEIQEQFHPKFEKLVYCALAYKRITAVLGVCREDSTENNHVARVTGFLKGSKAEAAGIRMGDVLKSVNGITPSDRNRYWNLFMRAQPGDKVRVEVEREGVVAVCEVPLISG